MDSIHTDTQAARGAPGAPQGPASPATDSATGAPLPGPQIAANEHRPSLSGASCVCGWRPQLGQSMWRSFDRHLVEQAHADRIALDLADSDSGDYYVRVFREAVECTANLRADLPIRHSVVHLSLLGAAVQTCDATECSPETTAEFALDAVIAHLGEH